MIMYIINHPKKQYPQEDGMKIGLFVGLAVLMAMVGGCAWASGNKEKVSNGIRHYQNSQFDRKAYLARIKALPKDYQIVYNGISDYFWGMGPDNGTGVMEILMDVLDGFENGARNNTPVLELTGGENIIAYCDNLLETASYKTWVDRMKFEKNKNILDKLKE
jgi:DNA-binding ferritin-like protein (Dps family)